MERRSTKCVIRSGFPCCCSARRDMKQIKSSAPTRIDLAGGTVDIWPLYLFHQNAQTVNAAISLRAHAEIEERSDGRIRLESIDTEKAVEVSRWQELANGNGLPLLSKLAHFFRA